ncbi:MAG: flotillin family protein [Epulopiscium sp.]|nr:flotillin family protein [Candidatus Epulonipiscium sp.]
MGDPSTLIIIGVIIGVLLLLLLSVATMWRKVSQDKALVITGLRKRVISGGGGWVIPLLEKTDVISLENMKIEVRTGGALTEQGVEIIADGVAVLKVKSDMESILAAVEQFNTGSEKTTIDVIKDTAKDVLEGKLREIISKMSVEEIYKDREKFASQVQEVAALDLADMGLEIKAFTIRDIKDDNGYLEALGKKRISEVKRDAEIAEAEADRETKIKTAEAARLGKEAQIIAETQVAEATKDKDLKVQSYRRVQEAEKAKADLAYAIEESKIQQEVEAEKMKVQIVRKEKEIELAEQEALRRERELEATVKKQADAEKYSSEKGADAKRYREIQEAQAQAEAIKATGSARAEARRLEGMAEVDIIREKGIAEAEAMMKKAEAFKQYNDAAITQMIIEKLPEIARAVAEPLSKTEKIVIIDSGEGNGKGGAAKVTDYVTQIISSLPETVEAITGIDIGDVLKSQTKGATTWDHSAPTSKEVNIVEVEKQ